METCARLKNTDIDTHTQYPRCHADVDQIGLDTPPGSHRTTFACGTAGHWRDGCMAQKFFGMFPHLFPNQVPLKGCGSLPSPYMKYSESFWSKELVALILAALRGDRLNPEVGIKSNS